MKALAGLVGRYRVDADPLRSERRAELLVLLLGVVLLLQLLYSGARLLLLPEPEPVLPPVELLAGGGNAAAGAADAALRAELGEAIRDRPLFWQSRRPAVEEVAAAPAQQAANPEKGVLDEVRLVGIFGEGNSAGVIALVKGKKQRILSGQELGGWTLDSIRPDGALFRNKGRTRGLKLKPSSVGDEQ